MTMIEPRSSAVAAESLDSAGQAVRSAEQPLGFEAVAETTPSLRGRKLGGFLLLIGISTLVFAQIGFVLSQVLDSVWQARVEVEYRGNSWTETEDIAVRSRSLTGPIAADYGVEIKEFEEDLGPVSLAEPRSCASSTSTTTLSLRRTS